MIRSSLELELAVMIELIKSLAKKTNTVYTLSTNKPNWITKVDRKGLYVETESSRNKYKKGEKAESGDFISFEFIYEAWQEFTSVRTATANEFVKTRGRTSFLMSFFSQFPFVKVVKKDNSTAIALTEFKTDDLPNEQYRKVITFLEEVINGNYDPKTLRQEIKEDNLYRVKSRGRQDLRLLGFLNQSQEIQENVFLQYKEAKDKNKIIRRLILDKEYFLNALFVLDILRNQSVHQKKSLLVDLGKLIVVNSQGENLMVDSVAKERTQNLLMWFKETSLVDENLRPLINVEEMKGTMNVTTKLNELFQYIMNNYLTARTEKFSSHEMGRKVRHEVTSELKQLPFIDDEYVVTGSVGQGNWAVVPWLAIMNKKVTTSTQRGYYIVYLFSEDMKRLYLTIAQGVTETTPKEMAVINEEIHREITMDPKVNKDEGINLGESKRARDYAKSTAAYIKYSVDDMPDEEELVKDLEKMVSYYEEYITFKNNYTISKDPDLVHHDPGEELSSLDVVQHIHEFIRSKGFYYTKDEVANLYLSLKSKPFVILSGISGTGKTKMVQWFAESVGATEKNGQFALIPVRPDWSDGSDLLGYTDIKGDFNPGPLTKILKEAIAHPENPYFVLLDEMNLARVEYYFSDLLSVMESRKWENGQLVTSLVLPEEVTGEKVYLPGNVFILGTVNMDETTHPFSKKVLDRANTIEFNRVQLDHLDFLKDNTEKHGRTLSPEPFKTRYLHLKDVYEDNKELVERVTAELVKINEILKINASHVGYRVRDEICFFMANNDNEKLMAFDSALDTCILQKVLPRLSGSDSRIGKILIDLYRLFTNKQIDQSDEVEENDFVHAPYPKSAEKVAEMLRRLEDDGFTSFWVSS